MRAEHLLPLFVLPASALMFTLELLAGRLLDGHARVPGAPW